MGSCVSLLQGLPFKRSEGHPWDPNLSPFLGQGDSEGTFLEPFWWAFIVVCERVLGCIVDPEPAEGENVPFAVRNPHIVSMVAERLGELAKAKVGAPAHSLADQAGCRARAV